MQWKGLIDSFPRIIVITPDKADHGNGMVRRLTVSDIESSPGRCYETARARSHSFHIFLQADEVKTAGELYLCDIARTALHVIGNFVRDKQRSVRRAIGRNADDLISRYVKHGIADPCSSSRHLENRPRSSAMDFLARRNANPHRS